MGREGCGEMRKGWGGRGEEGREGWMKGGKGRGGNRGDERGGVGRGEGRRQES